MTQPLVRAVVFDLDDTLYLERDFAFSGFDAVARAFAECWGDPATAAARMRWHFDHGQRGRVFDTLLAEHGVPSDRAAELVPRMIGVYREHSPSIKLFSEADDVLTALLGRVCLGLITDGPARMQRNKIEALGLHSCVDHIILTDELGPGMGKPNPAVFERMAVELGVGPRDCVYVADNRAKDFLACNRLGWRSVLVRRPDGVYASAVAPEGGEPELAINDLRELPGLFGLS